MRQHKVIPEHDHLRFLSKIRVETNGCWIIGNPRAHGAYSHYYINKIQYQAHRVSFEIFNGSLKQGLVIDHVCMNRKCCNPEHLRQVDQRTNLLENTSRERVNRFIRKNICISGHSMTESNTIWFSRRGKPQKFRMCRECNRLKKKQWYEKVKSRRLS